MRTESDYTLGYNDGFESGYRHAKDKYERRTGKWIAPTADGATCSSCGEYNKWHARYCKFCGSDNDKKEETT